MTHDEFITIRRAMLVVGQLRVDDNDRCMDDTLEVYQRLLAFVNKYEPLFTTLGSSAVFTAPRYGTMTTAYSSGRTLAVINPVLTGAVPLKPLEPIKPPELKPLPVNEINECFRKAQDWEDFGRRIEAKHNITLQGETA